MMVADSTELLVAAETAYTGVITDHVRYAGPAAEVVDHARRAGAHEALAVGLRALAWARHVVLDNDGARKLLDEAIRIAVRHRLDRRLGELLITRAIALHELGRYDAAARDLRRAEPLVPAHERPDLMLQRALLAHNTGQVRVAAALYRRVLDDGTTPPVQWAKAANNLSVAETQLGRPDVAIEYLDRAIKLADEIGPRLVAILHNSRAWSSFYAGRVADSIRGFEEAGRLYAAAGIPLGEHLLDYTDALVDLRLLDEARAVARAAAAELDRYGARLMAAEARIRCARLALAQGDLDVALVEAEAAARDLRRQRRPAWVAQATIAAVQAAAARDGYGPAGFIRLQRAAATLQRLGWRAHAVDAHVAVGRAALALGRRAAARRHLTRAGALAAGQPLVVRLQGRLARALLASVDPAGGAVLGQCRAGLTELARHRSALPSIELRILAAGHGAELGALGLRRLLPAAPPARVLNWLEHTRAVSLLAVWPPDPGVQDDVVALRNVVREIRVARREYGEEPRDLLIRQRSLETRIRRRSWSREGTARAATEVSSVGELRRLLDGEWLAEYASLDDRIVAVVVGPHRTRLVELGSLTGVRTEVDALLFALRRLLNSDRHASAARSMAAECVAALSALLVEPLGVPVDAPLVVVPCAQVLRVPWSPLRAGPVCVAPSATVWARSRRNRQLGGTPQVGLVVGPGLPGAAAEVDALRSVYSGPVVLLPPDSTVDDTVAVLRRADIAHVACHGRFRVDSPLFSALDLSDGPLTLYELLNRGVAPPRVVVAACDSGVEHGYQGDEVLGFASAMLAHGTTAVVASGILLPDGASRSVMTALHRHLRRGVPMALALHQARGTVDTADPAGYVVWCGLTAYGGG